MIYFVVDVDMKLTMIEEHQVKDYVHFYDGRVFRTDGKVVQGMYFFENGTFEWHDHTEQRV